MLSIIIVLLVNLLIETSVSLTVKVPGDPVVSHVGSTVILPCWISPPESAEALEIRWYRHDQFSNPVLLYNHGKIQDIQEKQYRNRSSLTLRSDQSGGLKDGDVSLRLEKLRVQDDGSFHCYVSGENSYSSEEVVLKITALGSTPVLSPKPLDDGRVNISCRSSGWHPKPSITWTSDEGRALHPGGTSHSRGADEMFSVHSWTAVSLSDAQQVSCSFSLRSGEFKEGRLNIQGIVSSGPWKALFLTFLICALLGSVGFILYKYREKLTGKKPVKEICEEETMERLSKEETNTEEPKKEPDCEEGTQQKLRKEVVEDVNIEELRKHAVEITINSKSLHPGLMVTKDCKNMRDHPEYHHTAEEFPFQLCAFGAQKILLWSSLLGGRAGTNEYTSQKLLDNWCGETWKLYYKRQICFNSIKGFLVLVFRPAESSDNPKPSAESSPLLSNFLRREQRSATHRKQTESIIIRNTVYTRSCMMIHVTGLTLRFL